MGRKSLTEIRRKEILIGFYKVAKKEGLENTSIAKVAAFMEINPSLILHYFKNRDQILLAFNDYILERYSSIYSFTSTRMETREELCELIDRLFSRKWNRLISDGVFYSCYAMTYQNSRLRKRFKHMHDALRRLLAEALEKAGANGVIKNGNKEELAEKIYVILEGAYYYLGMAEDRKESDHKMNMIKQHVYDMIEFRK
jgi:AcrR family transcriptional regulator